MNGYPGMENWMYDPYQGYVPRPGYEPMGYERFRLSRGRPPWGIHGGPPRQPRRRGTAQAQYPITPLRLEELVQQRRTRSWIQYVLSAMGLMAPGAEMPSYSPFFQPQARRPTMFHFPPFMGGY